MGVLADNERLVMEMHKDGKNKSEIANKFGCTVGAVTVFLYNRGVKKQKTSYGLLEQNREKIIQWLDSGYSAYKIAKELGCAKSSVLCFIKKNNLSNKNVCKVDYDNLLKDKENEVVELYNSGLSCDEVGDITGHSGSQVSVLLKKSDQEVRDWKYSVDENFFDWIDSEEKAYILGWFFSDGSVDNQGRMRLQIQKEDEHILYEIKKLMQYDGPMYEVPPPKKFPNRKAQVCLCINRKVLTDKLIALGCLPQKSSKSTNIFFGEIMDECYFRHFVRGVFDGDGSIGIKKDKYVSISIINSCSVVDSIYNYARYRLNLHPRVYYKNKNDKFCQMQLNITKDSIIFCEWMYYDSIYHLNRKFDKYNDFLIKWSNS